MLSRPLLGALQGLGGGSGGVLQQLAQAHGCVLRRCSRLLGGGVQQAAAHASGFCTTWITALRCVRRALRVADG